jgi:hypothetical protein
MATREGNKFGRTGSHSERQGLSSYERRKVETSFLTHRDCLEEEPVSDRTPKPTGVQLGKQESKNAILRIPFLFCSFVIHSELVVGRRNIPIAGVLRLDSLNRESSNS